MSLLLALACAPTSPTLRQQPPASATTGPGPTDTGAPTDTGSGETGPRPSTAETGGTDSGACYISSWGVPGECLDVADCALLGDHVAVAGYCPGPAEVQCCTDTPDVGDTPAVPDGWRLMSQSDVTAEMTTWAVEILRDGDTYPMFSTTTRWFDALEVLARVEWHWPDFQNAEIHRGVTLYEPAPG